MLSTSASPQKTSGNQPASFKVAACAGVALLVAGLTGQISAAWGYALFCLAAVSLGCALMMLAILTLSRQGQTTTLVNWGVRFSRLGVLAYVFAVCALSGHYTHETFIGNMEWHWIIFGPLVLFALVCVELGIYRKLIKANAVSWDRYKRFLNRDDADPLAMRKTLVEEVIVHKSLWQISKLRWLRHTLIFWGFTVMFMLELAAVFLREAGPSFGWGDIWRTPGHPVRFAFDLVYDVTGAMMLLGCLLALYWRLTVQNKPERKFSDTPMVVFLLVVVVTGFMVEGHRMAQAPALSEHAFSIFGQLFASAMAAIGFTTPDTYKPLWILHVVASCALIAYLPATRLIHTCAVPLGRLMTSQKNLLAAKKLGVLKGLMGTALPPSSDSKSKTASRSSLL
jgi:nitrate reductase gamma subunit